LRDESIQTESSAMDISKLVDCGRTVILINVNE
jgi:hypothetical protein